MLNKLKGIDIAFYVFVFTSLGYLITFLFEWGYNSYFSLPIDFITLDATNITKSIALIGLFLLIGVFYNGFNNKETDFNYLLEKIDRSMVKYSAINILFQIISMLLTVLMFYIWIKSESPTRIFYIGFGLASFYLFCSLKNYKRYLVIIALIYAIFIPYVAGIGYADKKQDFLLLEGEQDYLIIKFYDKKIIGAKYDKSKKEIISEFKLISLDSISKEGKSLKAIKIDDLKVIEFNNEE